MYKIKCPIINKENIENEIDLHCVKFRVQNTNNSVDHPVISFERVLRNNFAKSDYPFN